MTRTKQLKRNKERGSVEVLPEKVKRVFDFEVLDPIIPEKIDDPEVVEETEDGEEAGVEVPELDDEELNPFKDKWEV